MCGVRWTQLGPNPALDGNIPTPGFAEHIHSKGKMYEHHTCGNIMPIIGDLEK